MTEISGNLIVTMTYIDSFSGVGVKDDDIICDVSSIISSNASTNSDSCTFMW